MLRSVRSKRTAWLSARLDRLEPDERERIEGRTRRPGEVDRGVTLLRIASRRTFASLRHHRNYRLFFAGQLTSVAGTWMQNIALAWVVVELAPHSRGLAVGLLSVCRFGPFTLLGLFAGVVTDRFDNRRIVIATQTVQMVFSAVLADDDAARPHRSCGRSTRSPRSPAPRSCSTRRRGRTSPSRWSASDELPNAIALNSSLFNLARIFGPALAGVLIAAVGAGWCFAINTVSFLAVLGRAARDARRRALSRSTGRRRPTVWRGTREGFAYARRNRTVQVTLVDDGRLRVDLLQLQHPAAAAREEHARRGAAHVRDHLRRVRRGRADRRALGGGGRERALARRCSLGAGGLRRLRAAARTGPRRRRSPSILLFVCGVFFTSYTANSNASIQLASPDYIRGRVLGLYYYAWNGLAPLGALLVGWLCDRGGTELAFCASAAAARSA